MKKLLLVLVSIGMGPIGGQKTSAQSLDPTFATSTIYAPGIVNSALQQPDGKVVITGYYSRINGSSASAISRFNTNGTLDAAFQQNVGATATTAYRIHSLNSGQFLLDNVSTVPFTVGGITRQTLLRLNADGSGDATFNIGTGPAYGTTPGYIDDYYPLPNGQTIAVGGWDHFNGAAVSNGIVRLTATGAVDPAFNAGTGVDVNDDIESIVALPNGQYLVGGYLTTYNGLTCSSIIRLNADGTLDPTFTTSLLPNGDVSNILVQPDGYILISGFLNFPTSLGNAQSIARLAPNGRQDNSFTPDAAILQGNVYSYSGNAMQLQPDGKVLVLGSTLKGGSGPMRVVRLNTNGTLDNTFQVVGPNYPPRSITLLSNGNVVVVGDFTSCNTILDRGFIELTSTGALANSAPPLIQTTGAVNAVVRQSDGKLIAGGNFSEINGQSVRRLARFNPDGTLDSSFPTNVGYEGSVVDLALQPDGRFLAAGSDFLQRYLPTGALDNTFTSPAFASSNPRLLLQADGRVLLGGYNLRVYPNTGSFGDGGFVRLMPDGSPDNTFVPPTLAPLRYCVFSDFAQQPNGKLLVAGTYIGDGSRQCTVKRLETTGAADVSFSTGTIGGNPYGNPISLAVQNDGKVVLGGSFSSYNGTARTSVARVNPDGTLDTGFVPPVLSGNVNKVLLQPNGRILLGGSVTGTGLPNYLMRLLANGAPDASYAATAVPNGSVNTLLVQPDGAIVAAGAFTTIGGQPAATLARITATNVLHVAAPAAVAARTEAWPVPAHTTITVAPDASAHPQAVELLDLLGRSVLRQALAGASPAVLSVETLQTGTYLLRVTYAEGLVTRRVQVQ